MRHRFPIASLILTLAPALAGAQAPTAETRAAFSATWHYDATRSDPPVTAEQIPPATIIVPNAAAQGQGEPPAGGAGSGRRGGGAGGGTPPVAAALGPKGGGKGLRNRYVLELLAQLNTPPVMSLTAGGDTVSITTPDGTVVVWVADGKKRQKAMLDGSILEFSASWKGSKVELHDGVATMAELKRELKLSKDGRTLEIKLELNGPAVPKKLSRTAVYSRDG